MQKMKDNLAKWLRHLRGERRDEATASLLTYPSEQQRFMQAMFPNKGKERNDNEQKEGR